MSHAATQHLDINRRLILGRALMSGAASLLPLPYLDDLVADSVRGGLIAKLAALRSVDVNREAVMLLSTPRGTSVLRAASAGALAVGGTRRAFQRLAISFLVLRRVNEAMETFQLGTLFDHYCARHHVGLGLDGRRAAALRRAMEQAMKQARGDSLERAFRRALRAPGAAALRLPRGVLTLWARLRGGPVNAEPVDPESIDEPLAAAAARGRFRRAIDAVESELSGAGRGYLAALTSAFDAAWEKEHAG
jgi:hypothetical protein